MVTTRPDAHRVPSGRVDAKPSGGSGHARLEAIDGLRFLAALGVVVYHFTAMWSTAWDRMPGKLFPELGGAVVYFVLAPELFFVVSGFVILWTAWGRDVPAVVGSRVGRLFPPYWAALALTSLLLLVLWPGGKDVSWRDALVNVTLVQELVGVPHVDGVYWTLWAELRFYLLVVALVAVGVTRRRVVALATLWPLAAQLADRVDWRFGETMLMPRWAPYFAGGMLLFLLYRDGRSRLLWALVAGNAALALHTTVTPAVTTIAEVTAFEASPVVMSVGVLATFGTVAAVSMTRLAHVRAWWLPGAGALTYGLYLVHQFWGLWVVHLLHDHLPRYVVLVVAVAVSVGLAVAVHQLVEKPLSPRLRRGVERGLRSAVAAVRRGARPAVSRGGRRPSPARPSRP